MFPKTQSDKKLKKLIEYFLVQKRGYVYRLPKNKNVILTMTGGVDSSTCAQLVIEKWNSTVYPFYLRRGATAEIYELSAAYKVVDFLKRKYPNKMKDLMVAVAPIPLLEIKPNISKERIIHNGHPLRNSIIQSYAVQYGVSLNDQGIDTCSILVGSVASDYFPGSRDIDLLINTLYASINLEEWDWQILSPFFQPGLIKGKQKIKKIDLVRWGYENNFPFNLTRTCTSASKLSCGKCSECKERIDTFQKAGVRDTIQYIM